jgi:hypothetical protein
MFNALNVIQSRTATITQPYMKTLAFISYLFLPPSFISFFLRSLTPYLHFWTRLLHYNVFIKAAYNPSSWIIDGWCTDYMAVALYFHTKRLKEDQNKKLICLEGLCFKINSKALNIHPVCIDKYKTTFCYLFHDAVNKVSYFEVRTWIRHCCMKIISQLQKNEIKRLPEMEFDISVKRHRSVKTRNILKELNTYPINIRTPTEKRYQIIPTERTVTDSQKTSLQYRPKWWRDSARCFIIWI